MGLSRIRDVKASPRADHAHQPPKRGERRDGILNYLYEDIERGIHMYCDCHVDVKLTEAWNQIPRSYLISDEPRLICSASRVVKDWGSALK